MIPLEYVLVALVLGVASFVNSASGFGFALTAVAALPQIIGLESAIALIAASNLLVSVNTLWWNRSDFSWSKAWPVAVAICLTMPIGFWFLKSADSGLLIRILGTLLVAIAVMDLRLSVPALFRARPAREKPGLKEHGRTASTKTERSKTLLEAPSLPGWTVWPLGMVGGLLGGAFNVAGPPVVAYAYSQPWTKTQTVAVLQTVFLLAGLGRNGLMIAAGDYDVQLFRWIVCSIPAIFFATWLGKKLLDRLSKSLLKLTVFSFILLMGIKYLLVGM